MLPQKPVRVFFEAVLHLIFFFFAKSKEAHFRSFLLRFSLYNLSVGLAPASSPGRGASGVSSKLYPTAKASPTRRGGNAKH